MKLYVVLLVLCAGLDGASLDWKAGVAAVVITPDKPIWMAGYAARKRPSEGAMQDLYAKALALQDRKGQRFVLVTTDLLGLTATVSENVAQRARKKYGLGRERLMFNSSHTHCGPVIDRMLAVAYDLDPGQWSVIDAYTHELENKLVSAIGDALGDLSPARLSFGHSQAGFAKDRRTQFLANGPVDHDVPVLRVDDAAGRMRAVVFGYACHNTTMPAEVCQLNGDYAGFCQAELRKRHPGAEAFFVAGCGADANPYPRGSEELARTNGSELAAAVDKALRNTLQPVGGPLRTSFERVNLAFVPAPSREEFERRLQDKNAYVARHAREMLASLDRDGKLPASYPYPIQVWRFGRDLTWIALGGEVVVDYDLRLKSGRARRSQSRRQAMRRTWAMAADGRI
jgi:neutral ceramidase